MKKSYTLILGVVIALSLLFSACQPAPSTQVAQPTNPPAAPTATKPPEPTPTPAPKILTIASGTDIENTNIHLVTSSPSFSVLEHVYETLFVMTQEGVLEPLLAESLTASGENKYVITLKQGISFTDGTPFNAEAVKANLDWMLNADNKAPFKGTLLGKVLEVVVLDEYTVEVTTDGAFAPLPAHLSHGAVAMVSPKALEQGVEFLAENAIGTGPYILKSWVKDEAVTLERNNEYWGELPKVDTVVFKVVKEDGARIVEIEAGTVDVAVRIPPAEIPRLSANPNLEIMITPGLRTIYIFFNTTKEPFTDPRVRQAVNYAIDKEAIVRDLFSDAARVSDAPFAPPIFGYSAQSFYKRDVAKARELLAAANVAEGTKLVLYHPTGRYIQDALVADAIRTQLKEVGLDVELKTLEWPQYVPFVRKSAAEGNEVQFAMLGWSTPTMDADYALFALFHTSQHPPGFNGAFYSNPEVDKLLDEARSELDPVKRKVAYDKAIATIWSDAPWLFLYSEVQVTAIRKNVSGFIVHPDESLIATFADKQ